MNLIDTTTEQKIISGMLNEPEEALLLAKAEGITEAHFQDLTSKRIYTIITKMEEAGQTVMIPELSTLPDAMNIAKADPQFPYAVLDVSSKHAGMQMWKAYIAPLKEAHAKRLAYNAAKLAMQSIENGGNPSDVADALCEGGERARLAMESQTSWKTAEEASREFMEEFEILMKPDGSAGVLTGIDCMDRKTGGARKRELWVICGETSGGKTVMALQIVENALKLGLQTALFSLEMGAGENIGRMASNGGKLHYGMLRNPREEHYNETRDKMERVTQEGIATIKRTITNLKGSSLRICDEGGLTIERIQAICQEMHELKPLQLIVVDYVQLVTSTRKGLATHEELSWISNRLKQLAKTFDCPVITASQLNNEGRLAQAKAIGDHADVVARIEGEKGVFLMKNRNGERHIYLPIELNGKYQRFEQFDEQERARYLAGKTTPNRY